MDERDLADASRRIIAIFDVVVHTREVPECQSFGPDPLRLRRALAATRPSGSKANTRLSHRIKTIAVDIASTDIITPPSCALRLFRPARVQCARAKRFEQVGF
jgi:hypothetical protein